MKCPFLKELKVKFCRISPIKKMIPHALPSSCLEKCSSRNYMDCATAGEYLKNNLGPGELSNQDSCPFLVETFVQYCSVSPKTKFIPYNDIIFSRCNSDSHRYCQLFMANANPENANTSIAESFNIFDNDSSHDCRLVNGINIPEGLAFSKNHMWIDIGTDGSCHIGVDEFFAKTVGRVDRVAFLQQRGNGAPAIKLTVGPTSFRLVFPNDIYITGHNSHLLNNPEKLVTDPYGRGWLFEGLEPVQYWGNNTPNVLAGLIKGREAITWMQTESERLSKFVRQRVSSPDEKEASLMTDGGNLTGNLSEHLNSVGMIDLFSQFFPNSR